MTMVPADLPGHAPGGQPPRQNWENSTPTNGEEFNARSRDASSGLVHTAGGMTQPAIAAAMGVSLSTVNRAHMAYDHGGIKALKPKPNGGRKHENMTLAEEKALLARFAKAAGAGEMLNIHDLKAAYERAIGHTTSNSTVYNLLARHGWRKLMPRPSHPKRDIAAAPAGTGALARV